MAETVTGVPVESDDAADVERARHDRQAFAPLYVRYFDRVYGYCYHRLGNAEEAADATSLIFTRALAALPACRPESFRSWLFTIAHHALADLHRQRRVERTLDDALHVTDGEPSPEDTALASEARSIVAGLLAQLSEDQRSVLELRLAGLSSREIGEVIGKHPNAVDQMQFRAMTRLRALTGSGSAWTEGAR